MGNFIYRQSARVTALYAQMGDFQYKKHAHKEFAVGVTLEGIQHYNLEGQPLLSYPNNVMLFNPEQIHDGKSYDDNDLKYMMVYLDPNMIIGNKDRPERIIFKQPITKDPQLRNHIINLSQSILTNQDDAYVTEKLLDVNDSLLNMDIVVAPKDNHLINKAKSIIESHKYQNLKIEEISIELNMTQYQFIRYFKKHTGFTPYQYYLNSKIEEAKLVLELTKDIYLAVVKCGFVDLSHLNKVFKKVYGLTAFEYLNQLK